MAVDEDAECYICGRALHGCGENDHFPVTKSLGGEITFPACQNCHNDKDRVTLANWDATVAFAGLAGLWSKASREERLVLVKIFKIITHAKAVYHGDPVRVDAKKRKPRSRRE